jgi:hypothetical protein
MKGGAWLIKDEGSIDPKSLKRVPQQSGTNMYKIDVMVAEELYNDKKLDNVVYGSSELTWEQFLSKNKDFYEEKYESDIGENIVTDSLNQSGNSGGTSVDIYRNNIEKWYPIGNLKDTIKFFRSPAAEKKFVLQTIFHRYYGEGTIKKYDNRKVGYGWIVDFKSFPGFLFTFFSTNSIWLGSRLRSGDKGGKGNILIKQPPEYLISQLYELHTKKRDSTTIRDELFKGMSSYPFTCQAFGSKIFSDDNFIGTLSDSTPRPKFNSALNITGKNYATLFEFALKDISKFSGVPPENLEISKLHKYCLFLKYLQTRSDKDEYIRDWWSFYMGQTVNWDAENKHNIKKRNIQIVTWIVVVVVCGGFLLASGALTGYIGATATFSIQPLLREFFLERFM